MFPGELAEYSDEIGQKRVKDNEKEDRRTHEDIKEHLLLEMVLITLLPLLPLSSLSSPFFILLQKFLHIYIFFVSASFFVPPFPVSLSIYLENGEERNCKKKKKHYIQKIYLHLMSSSRELSSQARSACSTLLGCWSTSWMRCWNLLEMLHVRTGG